MNGNKLKEYAKAIAAFVAGVVVNVLLSLINGKTPWPQTGNEWLQLALSSFGPALVVALQPARISDKQVEKDPTVIRIDPEAVPPAPGEYTSPWPKP